MDVCLLLTKEQLIWLKQHKLYTYILIKKIQQITKTIHRTIHSYCYRSIDDKKVFIFIAHLKLNKENNNILTSKKCKCGLIFNSNLLEKTPNNS